ncbi:hypothetical protein PV11_08674 [Exophiala sideris]|uniref:Uncharacterized protein n=1 Tax=Exophiala sideris TaxID=1016849 RepID=A0A0D1Z2X9_9EURO|nr:hypothetical protein PV11_08674 [Exophiala sideris]
MRLQILMTILFGSSSVVLAARRCSCEEAGDITTPNAQHWTGVCCSPGVTGCGSGSLSYVVADDGPEAYMCSSIFSNCLDAGAFVDCCIAQGGNGAQC